MRYVRKIRHTSIMPDTLDDVIPDEVYLEGEYVLDTARELIDEGLTGKGVKVAVIDSGVDAEHPTFANTKISGDLTDPFGHGTGIAGLIAGGKWVDSEGWWHDQIHFGMAPDVEIISYQALGARGEGDLPAMAKAIRQAIEDEVDIINISAGSDSGCGKECLVCMQVKKARDNGILVVAASGNSGPNLGTMACPARHRSHVISVGAHDRKGNYPQFTSRARNGDIGDMWAPGGGDKEWMYAPTSRGSVLNEEWSDTGEWGMATKGTSFSCALVSGELALLLEKFNDPEFVWRLVKEE